MRQESQEGELAMRVTIRIVACAVLWTVAGYATLPVSFRLEPKTVLANAPALPTQGAVQDDPKADSLPAQVAVRLGTARYRHGSRIESMAVSADGKLGVTASGFGSFNPALVGRFSPARVFDLTDGRCLYSLPNEPGVVHRGRGPVAGWDDAGHQGRQVPLPPGRGDGKRASQTRVFVGFRRLAVDHRLDDVHAGRQTGCGHVDGEGASVDRRGKRRGDQDVHARRRGLRRRLLPRRQGDGDRRV